MERSGLTVIALVLASLPGIGCQRESSENPRPEVAKATPDPGAPLPLEVPPKSYGLRGRLMYEGKPVPNMEVAIAPVDLKSGRPVSEFTVIAGGGVRSVNTSTTTDRYGRFAVAFPESLLSAELGRYRTWECSLVPFQGMLRDGRLTVHEGVPVKLDAAKRLVDLGDVTFRPRVVSQ